MLLISLEFFVIQRASAGPFNPIVVEFVAFAIANNSENEFDRS
jgi:hypothetical protein